MRKPTFALSCLLASAALAGCNRVETTSRPLPSGPNVVLITIDTLRADYLGATGSPRDTQTPTLDALAGEGVRFANAISTVPITLPSHTSILTGLYPPHHGVRHNSTFRAAPELETIAERFQATGYATRAVVAAKVLDARFGLAQGFDVYDEPAEGGERASAASFVERDAAAVTDAAIAQLAQVDRPFFLWAHYYDPHRDYAAPQRFRGRFPNDPYAAEVAYVDEQIARLVAALRERGSFDRTVIAVTSDHGEGLGEHGETDHAYLVYEATQHVPWILRGPGIPAGRVVDTVVSNAAVAATLAQLAGVGALARADVASAVPLWSESAARAESWAYSESLAGQLEYGWAPLYAIRRAGEKFIQAPGDELYDLARDPGELRNLLEAPSPKPDALQQAQRARALVSDVRAGERALAPVAIDATTRAQMEALGYVVPAPSAAAAGGGEHPRDMLPNVALFTEALGAFNQREFEAAERYARAALERMPNSARAHELLSRLAVIAGRPRDGLPHALEAARLNPFHADYVAAVGSIQLQLGDLAAAARSFEEAVRLDPDDAAYRVGLVWKVKVGGSLQDAEAHAARAIELSPGDPALREELGSIWESAGEYELALATFRDAVERFPSAERLRMRLAIQYARLGEDAKAAEQLARAGTAARDPKLAMYLAIVYAARGDTPRAEQLLREIVARDAAPAPRAMLAKLLRQAGRTAEADRLLEPAPPASPAPR